MIKAATNLQECNYKLDNNMDRVGMYFYYYLKGKRCEAEFCIEEVEQVCQMFGIKVTKLMRYPEECNMILDTLLIQSLLKDNEIKKLLALTSEDVINDSNVFESTGWFGGLFHSVFKSIKEFFNAKTIKK